MSGSPVVHKALGGRKLISNHAHKRNESVQNNSIHWKSNIGSPRNEQQKPPGITTDRATRKQPPKPASHVGALKVPDSLKQQHQGIDNSVEQMVFNGTKKGAVGSMIDRIYSKDRRMVNNLYKGNMLSTAVLTDMHRYHNLKSSTGVEKMNYDELWL